MTGSQAALSKPEQAPTLRELLVFDLAGDRYALPLSCVREIMRLPAVTEVPRAPESVLGVISARGKVTTLIDLRRRLRLPARPPGSKTRVLLVNHAEEVLGMLVDAVLHVQRLRPDEIELASVLGGNAPAHLLGIGRPARADATEARGEATAAPRGRDAHRSTEQEAAAASASEEILLLLDLEPLLELHRSAQR